MFSSSFLDDCFELALGLNLYLLKVEVLISDRESDFCDTLFDSGNLTVNIGTGFHFSNHVKF